MSKGIPVVGLVDGCHAARAGVKVGDQLLQVNGMEVNSMHDYMLAIKDRKHSQTVVVLRDGILIDIEMAIGAPTAQGKPD